MGNFKRKRYFLEDNISRSGIDGVYNQCQNIGISEMKQMAEKAERHRRGCSPICTFFSRFFKLGHFCSEITIYIPANSWKIPTSTLLITLICLLIQSSSAQYSYDAYSKFTENISSLARFVNGIALAQSISSETLDKKQLIDELFYLGPNVTLDSLVYFEVLKLADNLGSIQKVLDKECPGDDGCGIPSSILAVMKTVDSYQVHFPIILAAKKASEKSGTELLAQFLIRLDEINGKIRDNLVSKLVKDLRLIKDRVTEASLKNLENSSKKLEELNNLLKTVPPLLEEIETKVLLDLKSKLQAMLPMKSIAQTLYAQKPSVKSLNTWLVSAARSYGGIVSSVNAVNIQSIVEQLDLLNTVAPHANRVKNLTAGFIIGFDDLKNTITLDQNIWLRKLLNSGGNLNAVSSLLKLTNTLSEQIESLSPSFEKLKSFERTHLINLKHFLTENPDAMSKLHTLILDYLIYFGLDYQSPYGADVQVAIDWADQKSIGNLEGLKASIGKLVTDQKKSLDLVFGFINDAGSIIGNAPDTSLVDNIILGLNDFPTKLEDSGIKKFGEWLKSGNVTEVVTSTKNWIDDSRFLETITNLQQHVDIKKIEELAPLAKNIALLKTGNMDVKSTIEVTASISSLIEEWSKLKPSFLSKYKRAIESDSKDAQKVSKNIGGISSIKLDLKKSVKRRNVGDQSKNSNSGKKVVMRNAENILKNLGDIFQIIIQLQNLSDMYQYYNQIITRKYVIDIAIDKLEDEDDKKYLKTFWNDEKIKKLRWNIKTHINVADEVKKYRGGVQFISDLKTIFEKASEVEEILFDFKSLARILRGKVSDEEIGSDLEHLQDFHVEFHHYSILRVRDLINGLQEFVDSNFGIRRRPPPPPPETTTKYYYPDRKAEMEYINNLLMCWAIIMGIIFVCIFYCRSLVE